MTKRRSGEAQAAQHRKAGPMKHRLEPRGGAKDADDEAAIDYDCAKCFQPIVGWKHMVEWMGLTYHRQCAPHSR